MVSVVGEEGRHRSGGVLSVIVDEFRKGEELAPVVLLIVTIYPQILLQRLVHLFRLPIRLRVICRRPIPLDVQPLEKVSGEMGDKLRASIGDSVDREAVELPNVPIVQLSSLFRSDIRGSGDKMSHFRKAVHTDKDCIVTVRGW